MDSPTQIENQTPKEKPVVISSEGENKKISFKFSFVNPKILATLTVLVLMITGIGAGVYLTQQPSQTVTQANFKPVNVIFQPPQLNTVEGEEFYLDVYASSNGNQITGANLKIEYPLSLTLKSITPGEYLPQILVPPVISQGSASVSIGTDGNSGVSGNGILASLIFTSNPGSSDSTAEIKFSPDTKISVLNRTNQDQLDSFGTSLVTISISSASDSASASASASAQESPASLDTELIESTPSAPQPSSLTESEVSTDFNNDGLTNSIDLSLMYSGWGTPETETQQKADLNSDGIINGIDYAIFLPNFRL